jgi:hypothetical protein
VGKRIYSPNDQIEDEDDDEYENEILALSS